MVKTLDMQSIRYANIFNKVTRVRSNHCFRYDNTIVFAVPRKEVMRAIGKDNKNLKKLNQILKKRIKIVAIPKSREDIEGFVSVIIYPIKFNAINIRDDEAVINASNHNKASLIGRNKRKLEQMENILEQYFGIKKLKIR